MNKFCVPYAYAKLLGVTPDEVAELIKDIRLRQVKNRPSNKARSYGEHRRMEREERLAKAPVRGVFGYEQEWLEGELGIKTLALVRRPGMTLARWAKVRQKWGDTKPWLVHMTGHALLYKDGKFYDNHHPAGIAIDDYKFDTSRVVKAQQVDIWDDRNPYEVKT